MDYFSYNASKVGMPVKTQPINPTRNTPRDTRSEWAANRQLTGK